MANESVYHKGCHAKLHQNQRKSTPVRERNAAFAQFLQQIKPNLKRGRTYDMSTLLALYKNIMNNVCNDPQSTATESKETTRKTFWQ